jgi:hypothetical protein
MGYQTSQASSGPLPKQSQIYDLIWEFLRNRQIQNLHINLNTGYNIMVILDVIGNPTSDFNRSRSGALKFFHERFSSEKHYAQFIGRYVWMPMDQ